MESETSVLIPRLSQRTLLGKDPRWPRISPRCGIAPADAFSPGPLAGEGLDFGGEVGDG